MNNAEQFLDTKSDRFNVCVHRGTQQIGGTCIELVCNGQRLLLDLGLPLDAGDDDPVTFLPEVKGIKDAAPDLLGLVVSHAHADHWGLAAQVAHLPIITGAATRRMLNAASTFVPRAVPAGINMPGIPDLEDRKTIQIGPFRLPLTL